MKKIIANIKSSVGLLTSATMILGFLMTGSLAFADTANADGNRDWQRTERQHDGDRGDRDGRNGHHRHHGWDRHIAPRYLPPHWYRPDLSERAFERYSKWVSYCQWFKSVYGYSPSPNCPDIPLPY